MEILLNNFKFELNLKVLNRMAQKFLTTLKFCKFLENGRNSP